MTSKTFPLSRRLRRLGAAIALSLPLGALAAADETAPAPSTLPPQELTAGVLYNFLLAEIAGARGQIGLSTQLYLELAQHTHDPRIARRATEIALFSRNLAAASRAAKLWAESDPGSEEARRVLAGVVSSSEGRVEDVQIQLARVLAQSPDALPQNLMGLNRALSRMENKETVRSMVLRLTEPYLDHPEAHFARAQASIVAEDPMSALAAIDTALQLRPDWEPAVIFKAQLMQQAGAERDASALLASQLALHPESNNLRLAHARLLVSLRDFENARAEFNKLLEAAPNDPELLFAVGLLSFQLEDNDNAASLFERALAANHPDPDAIRLHLGQIAERRKDTEGALKWYRAIPEPSRQYGDAQIRIAIALANGGRLAEARAHLQNQPGDAEVKRRYLLAEAQLLRDAGQPQQAFDLLEAALLKAPDDTDLLYESAMLAERLDRVDAMETRLRKLIALEPEHAHAYNALGYSLADRGLRLEEAEQLIARAVELAPQDPFILDSLGWVRFRRGDNSGAIAVLEQAYGLRSDPEIAAHLGEVLWSLNRQADANRVFDEALAAHPDNTVLRDTVQRLRKP